MTKVQGTQLYTIPSSLPADRWEFSVEHNKKFCMIPKIIHYCWFGSNKKPRKVRKCIATWKKLLPDYEFIEWNEDNFDINMIEYAKEAYNEKNMLLFLMWHVCMPCFNLVVSIWILMSSY